ncbi:formyl transferase [Roseobacter sp. YSTF-M11]|uniref:Formyl transferase n=1 Tax=Roseobacter insulae TaxID=2859783 RepID=A0A9X1JZ26_9RHOB|nr:formyl transferase [Roseobacter insulae]MBW4708901.1 formyl transferase [Roseobacter insulae]
MSGIVVIIGMGDLANQVARATRTAFPSATFIIPQKAARSVILRNRIRRHGLLKAFGQVTFRALLSSLTRRHQRRIDQIWTQSGLPLTPVDKDQIRYVPDVNSPATQAILRAQDPDVVFVFSVSKISRTTLSVTDAPFVNLHPGLTPRYRGLHTGYWALLSERKHGFGTTVHLIDAGLDTGPIIAQVKTAPAEEDNIATYNALLTVAGLPMLFQTLVQYLEGAPPDTTDAGRPAPICHEPTLWRYLTAGILRGIW